MVLAPPATDAAHPAFSSAWTASAQDRLARAGARLCAEPPLEEGGGGHGM